MFFIQQDGSTFKASLPFEPYFYLGTKGDKHFGDLEQWLRRKHEKHISSIDTVEKEDLQLKNHLSGVTRTLLKISFWTVQGLLAVRNDVMPIIKKNLEGKSTSEIYSQDGQSGKNKKKKATDFLESLNDIREYDVRYYQRVALDRDIRCGNWYQVSISDGQLDLKLRKDLVTRADPKIFAFDIETTKMPLKFPDATIDRIMMISYMLDGHGFLIINREIVSEDIEDFEYTPRPEFEGRFTVTNVDNEYNLLRSFFDHIQEAKPNVYVTYNGDFFDWPFVEARAKFHKMNMFSEIGVKEDNGEYKCRFGCHMDAFRWVKRDSYLPQGSQGLKAVTKAKLGYNPMELDPEDMLRFASEQPQTLASYSVSDAVATYYLYMKYVHPFVFSLCTIIPMNPDDVLRKGSGTLCESLLEAEAFKVNVIFPNKQTTQHGKMYQGHLLESETYVGGHVEALQSGVYRSDIPIAFDLNQEIFQKLIDELDQTLLFALEVECKISRKDVTNFEQVKSRIAEALKELRDTPRRKEQPAVFHLDVGAMYPNIILTNRLQPTAVVNEEICAGCDFNRPENNCQRQLTWTWRGEYIPASRQEYESVKLQCESERYPDTSTNNFQKLKRKNTESVSAKDVGFYQLSKEQQSAEIMKRIKDYSKKVYKSAHKTKIEERESTNCMRENPFYVDCVRAFRDRRYEYKEAHKKAQNSLQKAEKEKRPQSEIQEEEKLVVLYESLQLAHKCILNSFYGYVMRRGARWYSMEMAGEVTHTGSMIIKEARELVEAIGMTLELDTDGIWCTLPASFPQTFKFESPGRISAFSYPCIVLNKNVANNFTNNQYQTKLEDGSFEVRSECTIFFEVDGPYKAMILPASKEKGKKLKKRYAVFNNQGKIQELKGFEIKRRGELKLIKQFQAEIFEKFLDGTSLQECYASAASVANSWLDLLDSKGADVKEEEVLELLTESSNMSKKLEEYGKQKSSAITAAKRLGEFLGAEISKDKGLSCAYVISKKPEGSPVTERVIPIAIFSAEPKIRRSQLRKWTKITSGSVDLKSILDWDYYKERLSSVILKIITIPANYQKIANPVPRVAYPDWLQKQMNEEINNTKQRKIVDIFEKKDKSLVIEDMENIGKRMFSSTNLVGKRVTKKKKEEELAKRRSEIVPHTKYEKWLQEQKKRWKEKLEERKKRKEGIFSTPMNTRPSTQMEGYIQRQNVQLIQSVWQVIQIAETTSPDVFIIWALVGDVLHSIKLKELKTVYPHYYQPITGEKKSNLNLPRGKARQNLYEVRLREEDFASFCFENKEELEGVYESKIPTLYRALVQLGCLTTTVRSQRSKMAESSKDSFTLDELESRPSKDNSSYLSNTTLKQIFFYHSYCDTRGIYAILLPAAGKAYVFVLNPRSNNQLPGVRKALEKWSNIFKEIEVDLLKNEEEIERRIETVLTVYKEQRWGPTTILLQSARSTFELKDYIPSISDFPVITVPFHQQDNRYTPLMWEVPIVNVLMNRFSVLEGWYNVQLEWSRFGNAPIGNLGQDHPLFFSDLFFARLLKQNNNLLWYSENSKPDLGGAEEDDNNFAEEFINPEVCESGNYHNVCIELDVRAIDLNAILQAQHVNEIEGGSVSFLDTFNSGENEEGNKMRSFDEAASCGKAFALLRKMTNEWAHSLSEWNNEDQTEDLHHPLTTLLHHLNRWFSSSHSKLYDPCLHRLIHNLMCKVFWQLLAQLKNLGCKIVYASFNKIIISTNKTNTKDALTFLDSVMKSLKQKDLFHWIDIETNFLWNNLLFMDLQNYGGVLVDPLTLTEKIKSHWNIIEYLPKLVQEPLNSLIASFILHVQQNVSRTNRREKENSDPNASMEEEEDDQEETNKKKNNSIYLKKFVKEKLSIKVFEFVNNIQRTMSGDHSSVDKQSKEFPLMPGSYLVLNNPALEFVKAIVAVFRLDKGIESEILRLRKGWLKTLNVQEFSSEAEFVNPCLSFVLHNVLCSFCNETRDLDLLRDPYLIAGKWKCNNCHNSYHKPDIESRLVEILQKKSVSYQIQDLVCQKCRQVKAENISNSCSQCAGKLVCKSSFEDLEKILIAFSNIAKHHQFEWLQELTDHFKR
eukprot:TRINITY_DN7510_c0_g1_i3.p1 TRINITY_DN7510_c0_g1~~TRINITY_DN7510_c0_g1_i3.p1  ORF type:complete len:2083 (+),score=451.15 TRINITY_DN7510_c0_g1_i3:185-6433(+)